MEQAEIIHLDTVQNNTDWLDNIRSGDAFWTSRNVTITPHETTQTWNLESVNHEAIYIYVAVIVNNKGFKVYYGDAERSDPESIRQHGAKLRNEDVGRLLFLKLQDFKFTV